MLTHITSAIDTPEVRADILDQIASRFDGRVIWGEDLMEIAV